MEPHLMTPPHWQEPDTFDTVVVRGSDAAAYLQSQLSQDLQPLGTGETTWTFLLDPTGKIEALARVRRTGDEEFSLDCDAGTGERLLARIDRFKIRVQAETELVPATSAPSAAAQAARIRAGWPAMGAEILPGETIPAETGLSRLAVSFTKGCYPGQELVERMESRAAQAPRRLRQLVVDDGAGVGDPVTDESGTEVGHLTSVAGTDAIGSVRRGVEIGLPLAAE